MWKATFYLTSPWLIDILFPNWKWWAMLQWIAEAAFLGESFVHFWNSDRNFQLSISTRNMPSLLTLSLLQFGASLCTFHLAQISYLAKICMYREKSAINKARATLDSKSFLSGQRQKLKLSHACLRQNNVTWPQPLSFKCLPCHSSLYPDIQIWYLENPDQTLPFKY